MTTIKDWIELLASGDRVLTDGDEQIRDNKDAVLAALSHNRGQSLVHASAKLRADKEVVLAAIVEGAPIEAASECLQADPEVKQLALKWEWIWKLLGTVSLHRAPEELRDDPEVVKAAVSKYGSNLATASERLRDDRDIVLCAVRRYGGALEYASPRLQGDPVVAKVAVKQHKDALPFIPRDLRANEEVMLTAVETEEGSLAHCAESLLMDKDFFLRVVAAVGGLSLRYAHERVRGDSTVAAAAVQSDYSVMSYVMPPAVDDPVVYMAANACRRREHPNAGRATKPLLFSARPPEELGESAFDPVGWDKELKQRLRWLQGVSSAIGHFVVTDTERTGTGFCALGKQKELKYSGPGDKRCPCRGLHPAHQSQGRCGMPHETGMATALLTADGSPIYAGPEQICWRYAFRWHLDRAREKEGCMVQLVQPRHGTQLSEVQVLQAEMAFLVGVPVFTISEDDHGRDVAAQVAQLESEIYAKLS